MWGRGTFKILSLWISKDAVISLCIPIGILQHLLSFIWSSEFCFVFFHFYQRVASNCFHLAPQVYISLIRRQEPDSPSTTSASTQLHYTITSPKHFLFTLTDIQLKESSQNSSAFGHVSLWNHIMLTWKNQGNDKYILCIHFVHIINLFIPALGRQIHHFIPPLHFFIHIWLSARQINT